MGGATIYIYIYACMYACMHARYFAGSQGVLLIEHMGLVRVQGPELHIVPCILLVCILGGHMCFNSDAVWCASVPRERISERDPEKIHVGKEHSRVMSQTGASASRNFLRATSPRIK